MGLCQKDKGGLKTPFICGENMKELQLVIRNQPKGREATPWLDPHRKRFAQAAHEAKKELEGTKLKGADKVQAFNRLVAEKLRGPE